MSNLGTGKVKLSVAIPASFVADTPHLREKTSKLGTVARACSIFGVQEIILYLDDTRADQRNDMELCAQILNFIETPQYLRKRLFRLTPALRFTGILPPLQTPPHNVPRSIHESKTNDIREGVVTNRRHEALTVEVGLEQPLECPGAVPIGTRVTVKVTGIDRNLTGEIVEASKISIYWGYRVRQSKFKLGNLLDKERYDLRIGTSRYGTNVLDAWPKISNSLKGVSSILVAFGSPRSGITEILAKEAKVPSEMFDYFINTFPGQDVATVRTEEALLGSLALLNLMRMR